MPRYLTPSKVGLLALISLYVESVVPNTATIPVLSFIISHLLPMNALALHDQAGDEHRTFVLPIDEFRKATITLASGIPGRTIWDLLLKKLWELNSFDALHVFFDSLTDLLAATRDEVQSKGNGISREQNQMHVTRNSPLGIFVRRSQLEFTRLQLHDTIKLWKSLVTYRASTSFMWKRRNLTAGMASFDINLHDAAFGVDARVKDVLYGKPGDSRSEATTPSTEEVEKLLEFHIDKMQRRGFRISDDMKEHFERMVNAGVTVPSLSHYVRFLDSWRAGDYPSSFDHLHRYFDYTMHARDRTFYQYALLNLAILQADFGCFSEALAAMQESISTARENKDMGCLNYTLSWLYHFGQAYPEEISDVQKSGVLGTDKEALAFLKAKARDTGMWSLLSTSLLSEAKLALSNGESIATAFESITKASHLNITKNLATAVGSQMKLTSSLFSRLGISYLAWSQNEIFMQCYASKAPAEDTLHFLCRRATALALKGRHTEALAVMDEVSPDTLRMSKQHQYWIAHVALLKFQHSVYRGEMVASKSYLSQIWANPLPTQDLAFAVAVLEIDMEMRIKDYPKSMEMLERQSLKTNSQGDIHQRVKLMVLKAQVYDKAGIAQKGFSVAVRAASLAYKARLLPILWEAVGAVGRVLISLKEFGPTSRLLQSIIPQVLECEDCGLAASIFSALADAHMGLAGLAKTETLKCKEQMSRTLEYLDKAFDEYSRIDDVKGQCDMLAKKAKIMHLNGDLILANDYAAKYLDVRKAAQNA